MCGAPASEYLYGEERRRRPSYLVSCILYNCIYTEGSPTRSYREQLLQVQQVRWRSGLAPPHHKPAGDCLASGDSDDETDEFTLDAAAVVAEEAVERKEARRVKPWLSELECRSEWQELAGDRLGWRKVLKSIKIRT